MPPFIPSKRSLSSLSARCPMPEPAKKPSLFDTADKPDSAATLHDNKAFLDQLAGSESDSSLSDTSTADFEDAPAPPDPKRPKVAHQQERGEDDMDWEDAINPIATSATIIAAGKSADLLELTLEKGAHMEPITNPHDKRKGPSKIERQIRTSTHMMHVQFLLFHNLIRNGWICDKEVQRVLVGQIPPSVNKEIIKWKAAAGLISDAVADRATSSAYQVKKGKRVEQAERNQRDWGGPAQKQERCAPNMSRGDPTLRLLRILAAYWKKRFTITKPGLRKKGYRSLAVLEEEIASFRNEAHDPEQHGERIANIVSFRKLAKNCEGSRDVGAQLFTALIRGLGVEARLVTSLQPVGFKWSKNEEASEKRRHISRTSMMNDTDEVSGSSAEPDFRFTPTARKSFKKPRSIIGEKYMVRGVRSAPIDLSEYSVVDSGEEILNDDGDDGASIIDMTTSTPRTRATVRYDEDMLFPTYWTEVVSPITSEIIPVDPLILTPAVASTSEHLAQFESRGAKADKAKQVFGYVVAYSTDGTAKDVTTRYLRRHMWPGRTKGVRIPVERVPVYNRKGKVKHYEEYDWFKTVISGYSRTADMRTTADDVEETKDLKAIKPEKQESKTNEGTLQGFKNSAEYVLERHLRRDEALRPGSKPAKTFITGKGDKVKEEPVYRRNDVEICRTGESWHKEGRAIKHGEHPMKMVPVRAVTLTRKREVEEAEKDGEKLKQGLYALHQTDWIIPPPIENGIIPKNAFGNIDCYVPTMVPRGAVHILLKSTVKICKRLGIDFAEAVTAFEFGKQRAVPVITGVVIAKEHEHAVIHEWEKDEEERRTKDEGKREKIALATWRKLLMGLRIIQRVKHEYGGDADGHIAEETNPFTNPSRAKKVPKADLGTASTLKEGLLLFTDDEEDIGGGFLADDDDPDSGGFHFIGNDAMEVRQRVDELAVENEGLVDSGSSNISLPADSDTMNGGPLNSDDGPERVVAADSEGKVVVPQKALTNGRKAAATIIGLKANVPTESLKERAAPKRKAAWKSEAAFKSQLFEDEYDEDHSSDGRFSRGMRSTRSKEAAVKKAGKRKSKGPSPRARGP